MSSKEADKTKEKNVKGKDTDLKPKLVFVYNADSGFVKGLKDYVHKQVKPQTYNCNLCAITWGSFGVKKDWKTFVSEIGIPTDFLHRDEFVDKYHLKDQKYPCAYLVRGAKLELFIDHDEINKCKSLDQLMDLVRKKVDTIEQ